MVRDTQRAVGFRAGLQTAGRSGCSPQWRAGSQSMLWVLVNEEQQASLGQKKVGRDPHLGRYNIARAEAAEARLEEILLHAPLEQRVVDHLGCDVLVDLDRAVVALQLGTQQRHLPSALPVICEALEEYKRRHGISSLTVGSRCPANLQQRLVAAAGRVLALVVVCSLHIRSRHAYHSQVGVREAN